MVNYRWGSGVAVGAWRRSPIDRLTRVTPRPVYEVYRIIGPADLRHCFALAHTTSPPGSSSPPHCPKRIRALLCGLHSKCCTRNVNDSDPDGAACHLVARLPPDKPSHAVPSHYLRLHFYRCTRNVNDSDPTGPPKANFQREDTTMTYLI